MRDWVRGQRPPPLPRRVAPVHGEVLDSYLRRLARANHQDPFWLASYLSDQPYLSGADSITNIPTERLAAATGLTTSQLTQRLPDLGRRQHRQLGTQVRAACRRCMARRGIHVPVPCHIATELKVCRRHQLWIGPRTHDPADQLDVRPFPDILRAQQRHHRLRRCDRADQLLVDTAHDHAERIIQTWTRRGQLLSDEQHRRHDHYRSRTRTELAQRLNSADPRPAVATYPEIITLTEQLLRHCGTDIIRHDPYGPEPDRWVESHAMDFLAQLALHHRPWSRHTAPPPLELAHQHDLRQMQWQPDPARLLTRIDAPQARATPMRQIN